MKFYWSDWSFTNATYSTRYQDSILLSHCLFEDNHRRAEQSPSHISLNDAKQSVSVGRASLPKSLTSFRLASSHPPYRSPNCVNLVPDHRRISHTADSPRPSRKFDLMRARTGMRFIERSLRAHDIFVIPHGWHSKYSKESVTERASLLPVVEQRPRFTVVSSN